MTNGSGARQVIGVVIRVVAMSRGQDVDLVTSPRRIDFVLYCKSVISSHFLCIRLYYSFACTILPNLWCNMPFIDMLVKIAL